MSTNRWSFAKAIYNDVQNATPRLVFADWLDEQDQYNAAARQRQYAGLLNEQLMLTHPYRADYKDLYVRAKSKNVCRLTIKQDGEIDIAAIPESLLMGRIRIYVKWFRDKQGKPAKQTRNYYMEEIKWVSKAILLNVCEVARINIEIFNIDITQTSASG